jgi:hypothetical protein
MASEYGLDPCQLRLYVVEPALQQLGLYTPAACQLVVGTALTESRARYLDQIDKDNKPGPAYGLWQMEGPTHDDIWASYLHYQPMLAGAVLRLGSSSEQSLQTNLLYGAALCRIHYLRVAEPLPAAGDAEAMARYWKAHYNTPKGAGTAEQALPHFRVACQDC